MQTGVSVVPDASLRSVRSNPSQMNSASCGEKYRTSHVNTGKAGPFSKAPVPHTTCTMMHIGPSGHGNQGKIRKTVQNDRRFSADLGQGQISQTRRHHDGVFDSRASKTSAGRRSHLPANITAEERARLLRAMAISPIRFRQKREKFLHQASQDFFFFFFFPLKKTRNRVEGKQ